MHLRLVIALFFLLHIPLHAQLTDDFTDGDLTVNPTWTGDIADFIITSEKVLQLNAAEAGSSAIYTPVVLGDSAEWKIYYRMEFAPSTSNRLRIYLMLDSDNLSTANGYFLEIGENGGEDALQLLRLDNGIAFDVAASEGLFGGDPSQARIRVTRSIDGTWTVFADLNGGQDYIQFFTVQETTYQLSSGHVFGIECAYTDTRKDKFFFDDVFVGIPTPDLTPAIATDITVVNNTRVNVQFNEELEETSALDPAHYNIQPAIGSPINVEFTDTEHRSVDLVLGNALQANTNYTLSITDVEDLSGNVTEMGLAFIYVHVAQPNPFEILINEIMADPSPVIGLPNAEYLELYNTSSEAFQLENFSLTVGTQSELLPAKLIAGGSYLVLVDIADSSLFAAISNKLAIDLPSLTNTGATIELSDDLGTSLHRITYDETSYQDPSRDEGGYSLELINPLAPCLLNSNLRASLDLTGGTPGRINSVSTDNDPDTEGPILLRVFPESETQIQVVFDEVISEEGLTVSLQPDHAFSAVIIDDNTLTLVLQTPLQQGTLYTLSVAAVADCIGNSRVAQTQTFALPQSAEVGDIFINEILFDPQTSGSRFIELINVSNKYIDLSELVIADIQGDTIAAYPVETSFLMYPLAITAITPDPQDIKTRYFMHDPEQIVSSTLPSFDRTAGNATVYTRSGIVLDVFDYKASYHNALLDDAQGVSLERISTQLNTQNKETWYSAAASAGFATPGLPNSQRLPDITGEGVIEVEPSVFSPDEDGTDDFLVVSFPGVGPGMLATVRVFDAQGRSIVDLAKNVSVGQDAVIRWDGIDNNGTRARIGAYILWIELYGPNGNVEHYKKELRPR